jgi:hypothetical protein
MDSSPERPAARARTLPRWAFHAGWVICTVVAIVRVHTGTVPTEVAPASPAQLPKLFADVAREEPAMRAAAAHAFPGDAWSQDDDFHAREQQRARTLAAERGVRLADVLRAIDDGIRGAWPSAPGVHPNPSVPPCRPRLSY